MENKLSKFIRKRYKRHYWSPKKQLEWLRTTVSQDNRWLSSHPVARKLTDRYLKMLSEEWEAVAIEDIEAFRDRIESVGATPADSKSWPDDHGQYECTCVSCEQQFFGGKGRKLCRECADSNETWPETHDKMSRVMQAACKKAGFTPREYLDPRLAVYTAHMGMSVSNGSGVPELLDETSARFECFSIGDELYNISCEKADDDEDLSEHLECLSISLWELAKRLSAAPQPDQGATNAAGEPGGVKL